MKELFQSDNVTLSNILNSENNCIRRIGCIFFFNCCKFRQKDFVKYNPLDYYRIFRTIGESEYKALLDGQHIVAPSCNNKSVMVTNSPTGVSSCTRGNKWYFVKYKDKPNFDPLAPQFYSLEENKIPHITPHNIESAEYYLEGGYNIEDVESITDLTSDIIVYKEK